eukprot:TRINITY_DN9627_c0_g1_i2.p1 TRINITY_DN9627_c0_g1~~TRINITY_DN9627_c0_g1_i2.p1  ORF type:complete len:573 (+),score=143.83 TRINITY_DN9627_c0_g1_i2:163-1719(+)
MRVMHILVWFVDRLLYQWKLGELVTTIPTIGFNVESVDHIHPDTGRRLMFTCWDVGGCDKIRPLWRHYYQNTQAIVFLIDSTDTERLPDAAFDIFKLFAEDGLKDAVVVFVANKQDHRAALSPAEIWKELKLDQLKQRTMGIVPASAATGDGIKDVLDWLARHLSTKVPVIDRPSGEEVKATPQEAQPVEEKTLLEKWLEQEDEPDEEFLEKLTNYTLDSWDHRTHLRIAWIYLTKHGRREGMKLIFSGIKNFIANSSRTKKTTFHETMTYFWTHMIHYAIISTFNPSGDFKGFLLSNPQLSDGGLFLDFYNKNTILHNPKAREEVVLPDKKPLPSIVPNSMVKGLKLEAQDSKASEADAEEEKKKRQPAGPLTDFDFIEQFEAKSLKSWSHESYIRVIWYFMAEYEKNKQTGVRRAKFVDMIFHKLKSFMGKGFHATITYFWIQMVHNSIVAAGGAAENTTFADFWASGSTSQTLGNSLLYQEYFSRALIDSPDSEKDTVLPDLKPLPSVIVVPSKK